MKRSSTIRTSGTAYSRRVLTGIWLLLLATIAIDLQSCRRDEPEPIDPDVPTLCGDVSTATTWGNNRPGVDYIVTCQIGVNAALTIAPGTEIAFQNDAGLVIENGGSLKMIGTGAEPITLRGTSEAAGAWKGMFILSDNVENEISYATISGGGQASFNGHDVKANIRISNDSRLKLTNSRILNSGRDGIYVDGLDFATNSPVTTFNGNTFSGNAGYPISTIAPMLTIMDGMGSTYTDNIMNMIDVRGGRMLGNHAWQKAPVAYHISGFTQVGYYGDEGNLRVNAGVRLQFAAGQGLTTGEYSSGYLKIMGTSAEHVVITGDVAAPGSWMGICFQSVNPENAVMYADISHGGGNEFTGAVGKKGNIVVGAWQDGSVNIQNCNLTNSGAWGIYATKTSTESISGVTYSGNASGDYYKEP